MVFVLIFVLNETYCTNPCQLTCLNLNRNTWRERLTSDYIVTGRNHFVYYFNFPNTADVELFPTGGCVLLHLQDERFQLLNWTHNAAQKYPTAQRAACSQTAENPSCMTGQCRIGNWMDSNTAT